MLKMFCFLIYRDAVIYIRRLSESLMPVWFFTLILSLFLILFSFSTPLFQTIAPALIWSALLLSLLLSIEMILKTDARVGLIDQLLLSPYPLNWICLAKVLAHLGVIGIPFMLLMPLVAGLFQLQTASLWALWGSTALGIPIISLMAHLGAVLMVGLERGAWLLVILLLPLLLPILLLGTQTVLCATQQQPYQGPLFLLAAILVLSVALIPKLMALALQASVE